MSSSRGMSLHWACEVAPHCHHMRKCPGQLHMLVWQEDQNSSESDSSVGLCRRSKLVVTNSASSNCILLDTAGPDLSRHGACSMGSAVSRALHHNDLRGASFFGAWSWHEVLAKHWHLARRPTQGLGHDDNCVPFVTSRAGSTAFAGWPGCWCRWPPAVARSRSASRLLASWWSAA